VWGVGWIGIKFKRAYVSAVAAIRVGDFRLIHRAIDPALIGGRTAGVAFVEGKTAGEQGMRLVGPPLFCRAPRFSWAAVTPI
jgi:hypothetical protein